jgi:hypothetical protein
MFSYFSFCLSVFIATWFARTALVSGNSEPASVDQLRALEAITKVMKRQGMQSLDS